MKLAFAIAALLIAAQATAAPYTCAIDKDTDKHLCFRDGSIATKGNLRTARVYSGGPNSIRETGFTATVQCPSNAMELRDRDGVVFARNMAGTQLGRDFASNICSAQSGKSKKK